MDIFFQGQIDDFFQMGRIGFFPFVFDRDLFHPVIGSKISQSRMIDQKYFVFFMIQYLFGTIGNAVDLLEKGLVILFEL